MFPFVLPRRSTQASERRREVVLLEGKGEERGARPGIISRSCGLATLQTSGRQQVHSTTFIAFKLLWRGSIRPSGHLNQVPHRKSSACSPHVTQHTDHRSNDATIPGGEIISRDCNLRVYARNKFNATKLKESMGVRVRSRWVD